MAGLFGLLLLSLSVSLAWGRLSGSLSEDAIKERLAPIGKVHVSGEIAQVVTADANIDVGESVYKKNCAMCHATGLAGAPKYRDKRAWESRLKKGMETLVDHVLNGYKAMPARGGCSTCSKEDYEKAINYMTE